MAKNYIKSNEIGTAAGTQSAPPTAEARSEGINSPGPKAFSYV